jgi:hypothetical protein
MGDFVASFSRKRLVASTLVSGNSGNNVSERRLRAEAPEVLEAGQTNQIKKTRKKELSNKF